MPDVVTERVVTRQYVLFPTDGPSQGEEVSLPGTPLVVPCRTATSAWPSLDPRLGVVPGVMAEMYTLRPRTSPRSIVAYETSAGRACAIVKVNVVPSPRVD
jgi:hypothetical protein